MVIIVKKIYFSLFLLISLLLFIIFVININLSGNISVNKKYVSEEYLININEVDKKYNVFLNSECFDIFNSEFYTDELKFSSFQIIISDDVNNINYVVDLNNNKSNIYFNNSLIYSGKSTNYGMSKLCKYDNYYVVHEMVEFYDMITIISDSKILLRYHGDYDINDGVLTVYDIDYDKNILKVYDINLDNFKFSDTTIEENFCSEEVSKKYNKTFCFE